VRHHTTVTTWVRTAGEDDDAGPVVAYWEVGDDLRVLRSVVLTHTGAPLAATAPLTPLDGWDFPHETVPAAEFEARWQEARAALEP
jgi:hypothetical protein